MAKVAAADPAPSGNLKDQIKALATSIGNNYEDLTTVLAAIPGLALNQVAITVYNLDLQNPTRPGGGGSTPDNNGTGVSRYKAGEISVLGVDNYDVTAANKFAIGGTYHATGTVTNVKLANGEVVEKRNTTFSSKPAAESLLSTSMFKLQSNHVGNPDETYRGDIAAKFIFETGAVKRVSTGGDLAGMGKSAVVTQFMNLSAGIGFSTEATSPLDPNKKIGFEVSFLVDTAAGEHKVMSAFGVVNEPEKGIYGVSFGAETRNRLVAVTTTTNVGFDLGVIANKTSFQTFQPIGNLLGGGGTASLAWNDKTGTLTYQATSGYRKNPTNMFGLNTDISGELQVPSLAGAVGYVRNQISKAATALSGDIFDANVKANISTNDMPPVPNAGGSGSVVSPPGKGTVELSAPDVTDSTGQVIKGSAATDYTKNGYIEGKPMTASQKNDFALIFNSEIANGRTEKQAADLASGLLSSNYAAVRQAVVGQKDNLISGRTDVTALINNYANPSAPISSRSGADAAIISANTSRASTGDTILSKAEVADAKSLYNQAVKDGGTDAKANALVANLLKPANKDQLDFVKQQIAATPTGTTPPKLDALVKDYTANKGAINTVEGFADKYKLPELNKYTPTQRQDFLDVFKDTNVQKNMTEQQRVEFAQNLLKKENANLLRGYKNETNQALLSKGTPPARVVADIELANTNMKDLSSNLGAQISLLKTQGDKAGGVMLNALKGFVDIGLANGKAGTSEIAKGGAVSALATATGKTFSGIMDMMGQGDLMAYGAVIEDLGAVYKNSLGANDLLTGASGMRAGGDALFALGVGQNNKEMQAAGKMMVGGADFLAGMSGKNTSEKAGGAISFMASTAVAIGTMTGDKKMISLGNTLMQASTVLGGSSSITNLIKNDNLAQAGLQFGSFSLNLAGTLVGGKDGKLLSDFGNVAGTVFQGLKTLQAPGPVNGGTIAAIGVQGVNQVLNMMNVDIPKDVQVAMNAGISALSHDVTAAGLTAAKTQVANLISGFAKDAGLNVSASTINSALNTVGNAAAIGMVAYNVANLGFAINDIAKRTDINDAMKASLSLKEFSNTLLSGAAAQGFANPVAWGMAIAAGVTKTVGGAIDLIDNGVTGSNWNTAAGFGFHAIGMPGVGELVNLIGGFFTNERDPNAWVHTIGVGQRDASGFVADPKDPGFYHYTGNKDAFLAMATPMGRFEYSMHEFPDNMSAADRIKKIDVYKPVLETIKATDQALADAINASDKRNGQTGQTMAAYNANLKKKGSDGLAEKQNLDGINLGGMIDRRYVAVTNVFGTSGTKAGQSYNAWADGFDKKVIDATGANTAVASAIADNPMMLDIPANIRQQILNTITPGSAAFVTQQINKTVGDYIANRYNPIVNDVKPQNDKQALATVKEDLNLTGGNQYVATPTVSTDKWAPGPTVAKAPGAGDVVSALSLVPTNVKQAVASLNKNGINGNKDKNITLLGQSNRNAGWLGNGSYEMIVDGVQNSYLFDGKTFKQTSNIEIKSGAKWNFNTGQIVTPTGTPPARRTGDMTKVHAATDKLVGALAGGNIVTEKQMLNSAKALETTLRKEGQDVTLLGLSKRTGYYEVIINGKQESVQLTGLGTLASAFVRDPAGLNVT